nr:MAG TPA: hypothetical protein [Caudoviricetes sp.]
MPPLAANRAVPRNPAGSGRIGQASPGTVKPRPPATHSRAAP